MQAPGGIADECAQARLDIHMDVLEAALEFERAAFEFALDTVEAGVDRVAILSCQDALGD